MARVFKRKDRLSAMSEINLTSLMDLVLCLLIIFMITATAINQSIKINLPLQSRDPGTELKPKVQYETVSIDKDGRVFIGGDLVTTDQLLTHFRDLAAQPDPPAINVRCDHGQTVQKLVDVLDLIKQAGLSKFSLDTQVK